MRTEDLPQESFDKYTTHGAYHWKGTYESYYYYSPRLDARYKVPLNLLKTNWNKHLDGLGLDSGCGDGVAVYKVLSEGGRIIGVDLALDGLTLARSEIAKRSGPQASLAGSSGYSLPFTDNTFDYVLSLEVIEHLEEPEIYLHEVSRILKPRGALAITTPMQAANGQLRDRFHIHEYTEADLTKVLSQHFDPIQMWSIFPDWLDRIYYSATYFHMFDKLVNRAISMFSQILANPYERFVHSPPNPKWSGLVALAFKK